MANALMANALTDIVEVNEAGNLPVVNHGQQRRRGRPSNAANIHRGGPPTLIVVIGGAKGERWADILQSTKSKCKCAADAVRQRSVGSVNRKGSLKAIPESWGSP